MNIAMFTNTYAPHVGGVARSVESFTRAYRARGHRVLVVAPEVDGRPEQEYGVVRVPAVQHFNGSDFAMPLPIPGWLHSTLSEFAPDVVHAHHPFLLGDTALRAAAAWNVPVVFTHHTQYEKYTHYVPGDSALLRSFVRDVALGYAQLADAVIAPSQSIASLLHEEGVSTRIQVIPTGFDPDQFHPGPGGEMRDRLRIPRSAFVIGHLGRLAPEKNLAFLTRSVVRAMRRRRHLHFLVVGGGPSAGAIRAQLARAGLADRLHLPGTLSGPDVAEAYRAMDVFAFASQSETQGMVLAEALACGVPLVAVDAPGVREVVQNGVNGVLLPREDERTFTQALLRVSDLNHHRRAGISRAAAVSARPLTLGRTADRALALYAALEARRDRDDSLWSLSLRRIGRELEILLNLAGAAGLAVFGNAQPGAVQL